MPKLNIMFNAQQIIEKFVSAVDIADSIIKYSLDFDFPDNTDLDSVSFNEVAYDANGNAIFDFDFDYEVEEDEYEDEDEDPDGSEGEDL